MPRRYVKYSTAITSHDQKCYFNLFFQILNVNIKQNIDMKKYSIKPNSHSYSHLNRDIVEIW